MIEDQGNYLSVPQLSAADVKGIIQTWLNVEKRALTSRQMAVVENTFKHYPLPLFLKLCFDEAYRWTSYMPIEEVQLETSIRGIINTLFARVERSHGQMLVSHMLAYMTLSKLLRNMKL